MKKINKNVLIFERTKNKTRKSRYSENNYKKKRIKKGSSNQYNFPCLLRIN